MIYIMQRGDICIVQATINGWPRWYLARIVECEHDARDNWNVSKVRIIGEEFDRDDSSFGGVYRITAITHHDAAKQLAVAQCGKPVAYPDLNAVRAAILARCGDVPQP